MNREQEVRRTIDSLLRSLRFLQKERDTAVFEGEREKLTAVISQVKAAIITATTELTRPKESTPLLRGDETLDELYGSP